MFSEKSATFMKKKTTINNKQIVEKNLDLKNKKKATMKINAYINIKKSVVSSLLLKTGKVHRKT